MLYLEGEGQRSQMHTLVTSFPTLCPGKAALNYSGKVGTGCKENRARVHYLLGANNTHHMSNIFKHKLVMLGNTSGPKPVRTSDM